MNKGSCEPPYLQPATGALDRVHGGRGGDLEGSCVELGALLAVDAEGGRTDGDRRRVGDLVSRQGRAHVDGRVLELRSHGKSLVGDDLARAVRGSVVTILISHLGEKLRRRLDVLD